MNGLQTGSTPARRAALAAHALASEDQAWLMDALAPGHRAMLQPLLDDLKALGIPADAPPVQAAAGIPLRRRLRLPDPGPAESARVPPQADALVSWLSQEPTALAQRILGLQAWSWAADVRRRLGIASIGDLPAAPALDAWLRTEVQARLDTLPAPGPETLLMRWLRRMRERGHA